jgi:hypothetical protein
MNNLNSLDPLFSGQSSYSLMNNFSSSASPVSFGSVFDQALSQAKTSAQQAKVLWLQSQYTKQNILYGMFSNPKTSLLGFGGGDLFGTGGLFGLPSWAYDLQRIMGDDPNVKNLMGLSMQASLLSQSLKNNSLGSLGLDGGINSIV